MAKSMYNTALLQQAKDLVKWIKGDIQEVDLSAFNAISESHQAQKGKTARKHWGDQAQIVTLESGSTVTIGSINAHTKAVGDVLGALGYRGSFYITNTLKLTRTKLTEEKDTYVTVADILEAAKAK